jgi:hypothetical protein
MLKCQNQNSIFREIFRELRSSPWSRQFAVIFQYEKKKCQLKINRIYFFNKMKTILTRVN